VILGLFDVLGFESQFVKIGLKEIARKYRQLIRAVGRAADRPDVIVGLMPDELPIEPEPDEGMVGVLIARSEIYHAYFSDTILLWSPYYLQGVPNFLDACVNMFQESLEVGLPVRGAISIGDVIQCRHITHAS
jgi:hypothetical protein